MRSSGILMHITSLPGPYGIGTMGKAAFDFIDFLKKAGQSCWQILPVGPTGFGDSPYQTYSAFAGGHYLIDLGLLVEDGLLQEEEIADISWCEAPNRVDYSTLFETRMPVLKLAFSRFDRETPEYLEFVEKEAFWLEDYALFMALKTHFGGKAWSEWPDEIRNREADALVSYREELAEAVALQQFLQYEFFTQWKAVRDYAHENGIRIIGDIPIYVPLDSADVWSEPANYQLDEERRPKCVAGVPPDYFSEDGQLWGNPIYDWDKMKEDGYGWWIRRLRSASKVCDVIRIDHFRGIESYWSVPYGDETARNGHWVKGPDMDLIDTIKRELPDLDFIAEDLGVLTPEVLAMVEKSGFPGMKVLQFAFDPVTPSSYLPHFYDRGCICYTGTHDNETLVQWAESVSPDMVEYACRYIGKRESETISRAIVRAGMASVADLFITQMQDWLELGAEARMNHPGVVDGQNWRWRLTEGLLTEELAEEIVELTALYCRCEKPAPKTQEEEEIPMTENIASYIDHTILKPDATAAEINTLCEEAIEYGFASVCVNPCRIAQAAEKLAGTDVIPCCVVGFPLGAIPSESKAAETAVAVRNGAREIDMVINVGEAKDGNWELVEQDIAAVKAACGDAHLKVIIECCLLTDEEKVKACLAAKAAGADFVKTSTGFSKGGATVQDVALMRKTVGPDMGVKAAGGIRTRADAEAMIAAGANRIGASAGIAIVKG